MQRVLLPARTILGHRGFLVALVCCFVLGLAYSFVVPFFSMFGTIEAGMNPLTFGVFMTITSLSSVVSTTMLARWSDTHYSRRAMLVLGAVCGALGYGSYAVVRDVVWLTVIGATLIAVSNLTFSQLFAHARELIARSSVPPADAPLYMNVFRLFFALSWTAGPAAGAWIMTVYSFPGLFLTTGLLFVLFLAIVLRHVPSAPPPGAHEAQVPLRRVLQRVDLLAYFFSFVLVFASTTMCMMNLPLLVLHDLGGTSRHIGIIYSISPFFELPLLFYFGLLASKGDQARIIRTGVSIAITYFALLAFVRAPWQVYPLQILNAAMIAVVSGVAITFFQNYLPGQAGTATNLYSSAQRTGSTAGYLLFGTLAGALGYRLVFVVCAALCAVSLALLFIHRRQTAAPPGVTTEPVAQAAA
jgi:SET family sugar efflux transporter-like MFS transporter